MSNNELAYRSQFYYRKQKEDDVMEFKLHAPYQPTGDQPQAIEELVKGFKEGNQFQTLLGVTGSGKTFTMANVIAALNKPTLIISHNKTLAGQLYSEFKEFFPENAVEYFVSYYAQKICTTKYWEKYGFLIYILCLQYSHRLYGLYRQYFAGDPIVTQAGMTVFRTAKYVHFWWLLVNPKIPYNIERENKIELGTE